jgi:hypothetical protein
MRGVFIDEWRIKFRVFKKFLEFKPSKMAIFLNIND